jgi:hypothetical protein
MKLTNKRRVESQLGGSSDKRQRSLGSRLQMGAGRKTYTYDVDTRAGDHKAQYNFENSQRNLQDELGGCIFGTTRAASLSVQWHV